MGFVLTLAYLLSIHMGLPERFPFLAAVRPQLSIAILTVLASLPVLWRLPRPLPWRQTALLLTFVSLVVLSWAPQGYMGGVIKTAQDFLPDVAAFFFVALHVTTMRRLKIFAIALICGAMFTVIEGVSQYHLMDEVEVDDSDNVLDEPPYVMVQRLSDDNGGEVRYLKRLRGLGILNDPNDYSQYLLILMPFMLLLWDRAHKWRSILLLALPAVICFYGVYLSRSRGALVGMMVFAGLMMQGSLRLIGAVVGAGLFLAMKMGVDFTGGRGINAEEGSDRLELWSYGLEMIKDSPLWGVGYKAYADQTGGLTAHNSFVLCAAEAGLPAYFLWISLLVVSILHTRAVALDAKPGAANAEVQQWGRGALMSLYLFLTTAFFLSRTFSTTLYMLLGVCAAIVGMEARRRGRDLFPSNTYWPLLSAGIGVVILAIITVAVRFKS